jgi:predicted RNA-binding protein YlxR (DUF448 family)
VTPAGPGVLAPAASPPLRTCVGCRRVRRQDALLRLVRRPDGTVEPDLRPRGAGRGAYLCYREECLTAAARRGAWTHAFRSPSALRPETQARVRVLIAGRAGAADGDETGFQGGR